jgi:hypothetical protein
MHALVIVLLIIGIFDVLTASIGVGRRDGVHWLHFSLTIGGVAIGAAVAMLVT